MTTTAGLDLQRGRPLPAVGTTEAKLQQRKLDALKRGVHRIADASSLPYGIHLVGIGGTGVQVVERFLSEAPKDLLDVPGSRLSALAVDIGDADLEGVRRAAKRFGANNAHIETIALPLPSRQELDDSLARYSEFLKLEYPLYHPNPDSNEWLPPKICGRDESGSVPRSLAKAVYGRAFYDNDRPMLQALRRFARSVDKTGGETLVCIVFGLAGGTGSAIAMDLSRHLSAGQFGRRVLVTGIGVEPHAQEVNDKGAVVHTVLSELDVLCDETKNSGITMACGEQYRNPFTAGFIAVPQPPNRSQEDARDLIDGQIASLLTQRRGANLWEALRLLNWVAAPSTQHSAARTPWGSRWIHKLGYGSLDALEESLNLRDRLGVRSGYRPEFIELRTSEISGDKLRTVSWAAFVDSALHPELPTQCVPGAPTDCVQFLLPRMARCDLSISKAALTAYEKTSAQKRHVNHSLLLEHGLVLCEPSTHVDGMAGASIGTGKQWIAVPLHSLNDAIAEEV